MKLLRRVENVLGIPAPRGDARPVGMLLASLLVAAGFVWISGHGHPLKAEVGNNDQQETERDEPNDQKARRDARPDGADGEVGKEDVRPPGRSQARPTGPVSPDEKREFERQVREWKERIRDMIAAGQQAEAQVAEKYLLGHVKEMLERAHRDPFAPPDREALQRDKLITQLLHEARRSGRLEEVERLLRELAEINRRQQLAEARETGRVEEVERLERDELAESKRRAQPPADAVRGRILARLQQQMNAAIKNGRPDEVVELGHQIADVLRGSAHDGPPRPDGPAAAARRATPRRPDDAPRSDDPFAPPFSRSRTDRPPAAQEFLEIVRELREEISQLRREVNELRGGRGR